MALMATQRIKALLVFAYQAGKTGVTATAIATITGAEIAQVELTLRGLASQNEVKCHTQGAFEFWSVTKQFYDTHGSKFNIVKEK